MKRIFEYKDIIWGYTDENSEKNIIAYKDGIAKISYADANFGANEEVLGFFNKGKFLYAIITDPYSGTDTYRIMRLDKINTMALDTWTQVLLTSGRHAESFTYWEDLIYIYSVDGVYALDVDAGSDSLVTSSMPAGIVSVPSSLYIGDRVFNFMATGASTFKIFEYDGASTFTQIESGFFTFVFTGSDMFGKTLMAELNGYIYYTKIEAGSITLLIRYNFLEKTSSLVYSWQPKIYLYHMKVNRNILYIGHGDNTNYNVAAINITTYVPPEYKYTIEKEMVVGEGAVNESLRRVDSDPVFLINGGKTNKLYPYNEYTSIANLQGVLSPVTKYGSRLEYYTDLNDVSVIAQLTLKDIVDQLVSLSDMFFTVSASNVGKVEKRDLMGYRDSFMTIKNSNDYGDEYIKDVNRVEPYPHNFKRITISWNNVKWSDNEPVSAGATETLNYASLDYSSDFVNNPILAKDIALYLLNKMGSVEQLSAALGLSYFLEGGENLIFKVYEDYIYLDENKEWKLFQVEHNLKDMTTNVVLIERVVVEEREEI